ncbi:MAG: ribosome rescue GTPase HflX [Pseudohongiellaceae bacterium]
MFFERPEGGEIAVLVHITLPVKDQEDPAEFEELVISAGGDPVTFITGSRKKPSPDTFVGRGKLEEIAQAVVQYGAELVLFNHTLSPSQERNLEQHLQCRVLDRTGLILDIFAQRARSHEGKLQVELAQLRHLSTRLKRGWTHLDRQKGGIGLKGAGETQLELDQRMIGQRLKSVNKALDKVRSRREQGRRSRRRARVPTVSLVGYTNAGKSTLFNSLTDARSYAANQLFATLDSTLRRLDLDGLGQVVLADTVGFISHLPHQLVDAFRATLEETSEAALLLHVVDAHNESRSELVTEVESVLAEIGAESIPRLEVFNKIDLIPGRERALERDEQGRPIRVWISAITGAGLDLLNAAVAELLGGELFSQDLWVQPQYARLRSRLYELGAVKREAVDDSGVFRLQVRLPRSDLLQMLREEGLQMDGDAVVRNCASPVNNAPPPPAH